MLWYRERVEYLLQEQDDIRGKFPGLHYKIQNGLMLLTGKLGFTAEYAGVELKDEYSVQIVFPNNYPDIPPVIKETGGRIPKEYHHLDDGYLCLGAPVDVIRIFSKERKISKFIENLVIPYLYGYSYKNKYGEIPYLDRQHGALGIIEAYRELLEIEDTEDIVKFLRAYLRASLDKHCKCPCGSGKKISDCHARQIAELKVVPRQVIQGDINLIVSHVSRIYPI